ncbi:MAG: imidazole glycerol phosphate synthase subunit HisF [Oscillospiraceae bacterium]|nr:imidazole glycerol phosphate synthase subunit HisF [Oscillospiraceae bacterium]
MITKRIIPCLDIKNGRVVKGINFVEMRDVGDPVEAAAAYEKAGADEIAFLDITATNQGRSTVVELAARVAKQISIPFTVGGGIRSIEDFRQVFSCGADKVSINTAAIDMPELISKAADEFGKQRIMVAIDAGRRQDGTGWDVYKNGGEINTGLDAIEWAARVEGLGAGEILLTSIDRDGTKEGYDIELTAAVAQKVGIPVIASGGAGDMQDFADAIIMGKADAVLAASLFHFHEVDIKQLKEFLAAQGLPVRQDFE